MQKGGDRRQTGAGRKKDTSERFCTPTFAVQFFTFSVPRHGVSFGSCDGTELRRQARPSHSVIVGLPKGRMAQLAAPWSQADCFGAPAR